MGYRSEIILGIEPKFEKEFKKIWQNNFIYHKTEGGLQIYSGEELKWYNDYEDVIKTKEMINESKEGFMVAIGEQNETHSEIGLWWDFVGIHTSFNIY